MQTTVNAKQAFGLVGTFYDDSARRVAPYNLAATAAGVAPTIGRVFTADANDVNKAVMAGEGSILGVLVSPHEYTLNGLDTSLALTAGTVGEICSFGHIVVASTTAVSVGNVAAYNKTTGEIGAYANTAGVPSTHVQIPNARFILVNAAIGEPAVLELGN